jgi:hypothetical protein
MQSTNLSINKIETNLSQTQFILKELKEYVDHFGDNLVLSSSQITVESTIGFAKKPMNLSEILKQCNNQFLDIDAKAVEQNNHMDDLKKEIDTKAPDSVLFNIANAEKKISAIELHLHKEAEQGIAVRF